MYTWIIEGKLAQSPLPPKYAVMELVKEFTGVVVLPMPYEFPPLYSDYVDFLKSLGLDVLYIPTPDYYPVDLLDLLRSSLFIEKHARRGGAVLVHCYGGVGRSGLVTASYLVYKGLDPYSAISRVREAVPGSVENRWQARLLEDYYVLVSTINKNLLEDYASALEELWVVDKASYKHLSKVVQFTIELYDGLSMLNVNLKNEILCSMFHVHDHETQRVLEEKIGAKSLCTTGLLTDLVHTLDYRMDQRVVVLDASYVDEPRVLLLCNSPCSDVVERAEQKSSLITQITGKKPIFDWGSYLDYC